MNSVSEDAAHALSPHAARGHTFRKIVLTRRLHNKANYADFMYKDHGRNSRKLLKINRPVLCLAQSVRNIRNGQIVRLDTNASYRFDSDASRKRVDIIISLKYMHVYVFIMIINMHSNNKNS